MSAPLFSVIVPAYNAQATLAQALGSLDRQLERDFEAIVVDDGSTDGTGELARRLCAARGWRVVGQANAGSGAARNHGVREARGRYLAFLDADDWLLPQHLARMRTLLESAPDVGLAFCDAWTWDAARRRFRRRSVMDAYRPTPMPTEPTAFFAALLEQNFVFTAAASPREVVREVGGFPERIYAQDWGLWLRIAASGRAVVQTPERLAVYRRSTTQVSHDPRRMVRGQLDALRALGDTELTEERRALLERRIRRAEQEVTRAGSPARWRRLAAPLARASRGVRLYRLRAPGAIVRTYPELARRPPRVADER